MYQVLKNYIESLTATVKKESVEEALGNVITGINDEIIPSLEAVIKDSDDSVIKDNQFIKNLSKLTVRTKDNKEYLNVLLKLLKEITSEANDITKLVDKDLSAYITSKGSTAKDIAIMKLVSDIAALAFYIQDLIYFILVDVKETAIPKIRLDDIRKNSGSFVVLFNYYYKGLSKIVKELPRVSDEIVYREDAKPSMMDKLFKSKGKLLSLPVSGFNGNPIYHIRMWLVDKEMERYELLKEKKKLIELKLLDLKLQAQNESDPKLKTQIEYYEDKIGKLEYNIKEIEDDDESVGDYIPVVF